MSGGHWNYFSRDLEEKAQTESEVWRFLAVVEHELDWGICCDDCHDCARKRLGPAMEAFFDTRCQDASIAMSIMRDRHQNQCERHAPKGRK